MVVQFGTPQVYVFKRNEKVQKRAARFVIGNYSCETEHDWHSRTTKVGISEKKMEER